MKNLIRRFIFAVCFLAFVGLAFNPLVVLKIQNLMGFGAEDVSNESADIRDEITRDENTPASTESKPPVTPTPDTLPEPEAPQGPNDSISVNETPAEVTPPPTIVKERVVEPIIADDVPITNSVKPPLLPITAKPDLENLPYLTGYEDIEKNDAWIGKAPCGLEIFDAPITLPRLGPRQDGKVLDRPLKFVDNREIVNELTYIYKSENGVTLRLVRPIIEYYRASGKNFIDANNDIVTRNPIDAKRYSTPNSPPTQLDGVNPDNKATATLAHILSPTTLEYSIYGSGNNYRLLADKVILTTAYIVTLPRWTNYSAATSEDQAKWDDLFCNAAHHELGHLRIRLDILAETLDGYASLPIGLTQAEIDSLTQAYRVDIHDRIDARQDAYHVYNGGGLRNGMTELPYAELPFPWLENQPD